MRGHREIRVNGRGEVTRSSPLIRSLPARRRIADRGQPGGRCAASCKLWFLPAIQGGRTRRLGT